MNLTRPWTFAALLSALLPASAFAHEYWLAPSSYRMRAGDTLSIAAYVGTGFQGERRPYTVSRTLRFELRGSQRVDLARGARNGDLTLARFVAADGAGGMIAYHSNFTFIELPAREFDDYLETEGLDRVRAARAKLGTKAGSGRERYGRCAKVWISGSNPALAQRPLGLPLEVVPMGDPNTRDLRVRVLYRGQPLQGALVRAWNHALAAGSRPREAATRDSVGPASQARTDKHGIATLRTDRPGEWLVSTVHMVPSTDKQAADWESLWASLTFARQ